jgi:hypothetical protein
MYDTNVFHCDDCVVAIKKVMGRETILGYVRPFLLPGDSFREGPNLVQIPGTSTVPGTSSKLHHAFVSEVATGKHVPIIGPGVFSRE